MAEVVFVKLGGSVLTDKTQPEALNLPILTDVARVLAAALRARHDLRLLLGHGGGSFGHHWANLYQTHLGMDGARGREGFARVQDAMGRLNRAVVATLLEAGINAIGVQPSAGAIAESGRIVAWETAVLDELLHLAMVPVVFGDTLVDRAKGVSIASTEAIFSYLVPRLGPARLVLVGESGVWTADPRRDPTAQLIRRIDAGNIASVLGQAGASHGVDVTGGMAAKVAAMWRLAQTQPGLTIQFVGPGDLAAALGQDGSVGTVMRAA